MRNIYQVDASSGATAQLLPFGRASSPTAVAYDPDLKLIYWTDSTHETINRYSLLTNSSTVIYRDSYYGMVHMNAYHTFMVKKLASLQPKS